MNDPYVNIHTHRPTGRGIELRAEGIHPWQAEATAPGNLPALTAAAQAVGEIGLDYARATDRGAQLRLLREQLDLAERTGLPVVLHCVRAFEPLMKELQGRRLKAVIFHGFIGSPQQAARALAAGYCLSFGERTFRSPRTTEVLRTLPADRLFLETDDSDVAIETVYARAAEVRGTTVGELRRVIAENYRRLFG
ncbi:MAG: TatD family hydrolase [Alistipes sp.]|jgi:hypothetical protein|uniref:TatD family hydrolase n=1 Tax=Alistipes sp. TaxID=1872444 RepID=UPI001D73FB6C|nr:TatD family hydrolase [Alistipes sp.]MBS6099266.1 TatD family hydrolase [Alistipes sp.]HJI18462.1 TatD family hydrolase [Rikenellaceae bacterium]